jgi:hypothetical protein
MRQVVLLQSLDQTERRMQRYYLHPGRHRKSHRLNQAVLCLLMSKFRRRGCQATVFDALRAVVY